MTFLNTIDCTMPILASICFWSSLSIGGFLLILGIVMFIDIQEPAIFVIITLGVLSIIYSVIIGSEIKENKDKIRYEVTIDKTVPFVEVMENYNVIEQRGDIYILEVK